MRTSEIENQPLRILQARRLIAQMAGIMLTSV